MYLTIDNKPKLEIFVSIFQLLKNWSSHISIQFEKDKLFIQSIDKTHICLATIEIKDKWFSTFECNVNNKISISSSNFAILMKYALKNDKLELRYEDDNSVDRLYINFLNEKDNKTSFNHFFELNLIDVDEDGIGVQQMDYDVEFTISSEKFVGVLTELFIFGPDLKIKCSESAMELNANGDSTKLKIDIPIDDLDEFAIGEGYELDVSFSLKHLCSMCLSTNLSKSINVSLSDEYPMLLSYNLGDDSKIDFYIAPKITDN